MSLTVLAPLAVVRAKPGHGMWAEYLTIFMVFLGQDNLFSISHYNPSNEFSGGQAGV